MNDTAHVRSMAARCIPHDVTGDLRETLITAIMQALRDSAVSLHAVVQAKEIRMRELTTRVAELGRAGEGICTCGCVQCQHEEHGSCSRRCCPDETEVDATPLTVQDRPQPTDVISELDRLAAWVRRGDYDRDDARDEIARAIENRSRQLAGKR